MTNLGINAIPACLKRFALRRLAATNTTILNDRNDTIIVNEVHAGRVDLLITEDRDVHTKAGILGIPDRVFTIDAFHDVDHIVNPNPSSGSVWSGVNV
jgi:predicted nuclease of predicted toxin-antitoxin system